MNRRRFLYTSAALLNAAQNRIPVIDSHIHLFDVSRPQGVPWPPRDSKIYKSALPPRYRDLAVRHGIAGAIEIECSPWQDDNQWVLDLAAKDPIIVGTIGDLEPGKPGFGKHLERLHKNPIFRGIRYGNIWDRDLGKDMSRAGFIDDLKLLASAGLVLDSANPTPALIDALVRVSDQVPNLTIMVDHLPELAPPGAMKQLAQRPKVFGKISGIVREVNGHVPLDAGFYRDRLDIIWETFGNQRLLYGSDWPNSDQWATYPEVFKLAHDFISTKDRASMENYYWKNSIRAYAWVKRDPSQPYLPKA